MRKTYKTVQVDATLHEPFKQYCQKRDISLGKFLEGMMLCALSGSISGSPVAELAFRDDHDAAVRGRST